MSVTSLGRITEKSRKKQNKNRRNDEGTGEKLNAAWIKNTVI